MRIRDGSSDVCSSDLSVIADYQARGLLDPVGGDLASIGITPDQFTDAARRAVTIDGKIWGLPLDSWTMLWHVNTNLFRKAGLMRNGQPILPRSPEELLAQRSEEHTSELQSLMRISYAVFCLKKTKTQNYCHSHCMYYITLC